MGALGLPFKLYIMRNIKYIIVNDTGSKSSVCTSRHRFIPHLGHCIVCDASSRFQGSSDQSERAKLLNELVRLRKQWPDAKILGLSELDSSELYSRNIIVSDAMNILRRELSDLS